MKAVGWQALRLPRSRVHNIQDPNANPAPHTPIRFREDLYYSTVLYRNPETLNPKPIRDLLPEALNPKPIRDLHFGSSLNPRGRGSYAGSRTLLGTNFSPSLKGFWKVLGVGLGPISGSLNPKPLRP